MNNFLTRTLSGSVYVALVAGSVLVHPVAFALLMLLFLLAASREFSLLFGKELLSAQMVALLMILISLPFILVAAYFLRFIPIYLLTLLPLFPVILMASRTGRKEHIPAIQLMGIYGSIIVYLTLPLLSGLMLYDPLMKGAPSYAFPLFLFVIIWVNDSMAYVSGKLTGRRPLASRISPAKTIEGFAGGLIFSLLAAYIWSHYFAELPWFGWVILALVIVAAGTMGDLFESWLKREAGIKDSGDLIPGHGGILDRIDSLLFAAPAAYACLTFIILYLS